ncbi:uncharacterized protein TNCV_1026111 [Trichonephila clavipes]|nr:uncharacterized protein TNCV_1026111 [Trichonephila clavipes]
MEDDDAHSGRSSTSKTNQYVSRVKLLQNSDRRMSIRMLVDELSIPETQVLEIMTGILARRKVCVKFVPRVVEYLVQNKAATLPHPISLQPQLGPTRLFSVPKNKHHGSVEVVQQAVTSELNRILVQAFLEAYESCKTR